MRGLNSDATALHVAAGPDVTLRKVVCWKTAAESNSWPSPGSSLSQVRSPSPRQREGTMPGLGRTPAREAGRTVFRG